jgi:hypothetical protein
MEGVVAGLCCRRGPALACCLVGAGERGGTVLEGGAQGGRGLVRPKEEEGEEKEGEKKTKKREKKKENKGRKIEKGFRKLGGFLGKLGEWGFADFSGFLGYRRQFRDGGDGEADRPAGLRCGIPVVVANRGAGAARVGCPGAGGAGGIRGTRVEGKELTGENTRDLLGGLLGAKNVGVTNLPHLK